MSRAEPAKWSNNAIPGAGILCYMLMKFPRVPFCCAVPTSEDAYGESDFQKVRHGWGEFCLVGSRRQGSVGKYVAVPKLQEL